MTDTYKDSDPIEFKVKEELRCIRCCLERLIRLMDEGLFVDYQMEKFGKRFSQQSQEKE